MPACRRESGQRDVVRSIILTGSNWQPCDRGSDAGISQVEEHLGFRWVSVTHPWRNPTERSGSFDHFPDTWLLGVTFWPGFHLAPLRYMTQSTSTQEKKFHELASEIRSAMLVTRATDGHLHARPMIAADVAEDGTMKFITSIGSGKVEEVLRDPHVTVTYQDGGAFLAISGTAVVQTDRKELDRVWTAANDAWFAGPEDPSAAMIVVTPHAAEYWDQRGVNGLKYVFQAVKAVVTGEQPQPDSLQHGTVGG